jgi:hypothetical protein
MTRTTTFSATRDDIIKAAMRKLDVLGAGETPTTEDYNNCAFGLNIMIKAWEKDGFYLWKVKEIQVPLITNIITYQIGPTATGTGAVVTDRPIRIMDTCYMRNADGLDITAKILSRQEYNSLGLKTTSGTVNQIFYDPQLTNGQLYVYGKPTDSTHTLFLTCQIPVYDFSSGTEALDFPQEGYQAVVYGLADEMMDEYPKPSQLTVQRITQKAEFYRNQLADWSQEECSTFFQPNLQGRR